MAALLPGARVETILLWSALPGMSRHHWGSDVDVADGRVMAAGYTLRLELDEFRRGGAFAALSAWLGANMRRFGFYRPYTAAATACSRSPGTCPTRRSRGLRSRG